MLDHQGWRREEHNISGLYVQLISTFNSTDDNIFVNNVHHIFKVLNFMITPFHWHILAFTISADLVLDSLAPKRERLLRVGTPWWDGRMVFCREGFPFPLLCELLFLSFSLPLSLFFLSSSYLSLPILYFFLSRYDPRWKPETVQLLVSLHEGVRNPRRQHLRVYSTRTYTTYTSICHLSQPHT